MNIARVDLRCFSKDNVNRMRFKPWNSGFSCFKQAFLMLLRSVRSAFALTLATDRLNAPEG